MIRPAQRTQQVQEYYFSQKLREIEGMNQRGLRVINLGIGNPDLLPPMNAMQHLAAGMNTAMSHGYQNYKGIPELRQAFSNWYNTFYRVGLNPETEILPLLGSKEGIMHVSLAFLNPGDGVLVPNPGYPTYRAVSELVGARVVEYNLKEENNWYPDFEELEKTNLSGVKLMWVNYPNMPTGAAANEELYRKLIAFAHKHDILLVNDNPYSFILNPNPMSILSIEGAKDVAMELNSLSKSHNMAGFRVGMIAGCEQYIQAVLRIKSNMDSGMYKPVQLAAAKALESSSDWYQSINREYSKRKHVAHRIFDTLGATYSDGQTGMFVWARIPDYSSDAMSFADDILSRKQVFITPGSIFGSNGNRYIRISLCSTEDLLNEALNRIA